MSHRSGLRQSCAGFVFRRFWNLLRLVNCVLHEPNTFTFHDLAQRQVPLVFRPVSRGSWALFAAFSDLVNDGDSLCAVLPWSDPSRRPSSILLICIGTGSHLGHLLHHCDKIKIFLLREFSPGRLRQQTLPLIDASILVELFHSGTHTQRSTMDDTRHA